MDNLKLLKNLNVLYAEDSDAIRLEYVEILSKFFSNVYSAKNGLEALEIYEKNSIHVIITDNRMPIMCGLELVEEIRKDNDDVPIFITTSFSEKEELLQATRLKLVDYMIKPISYLDLKNTLSRCADELQKKSILDYPISENISYSPLTKSLKTDEEQHTLQLKESLLLELFLKYQGRIVTKDMIFHSVYNGEEMSEGGMKNLVLKLRQKLGGNLITTIRGSGYILK